MTFFSLRRPLVALALGLLAAAPAAQAQVGPDTQWTADGYGYREVQNGEIVLLDARRPGQATTLISKQQLTPAGQSAPLQVRRFALSDNGRRVLLNTNTRKVWRYDTRGDYWVYDLDRKQLTQLGKGRPEASASAGPPTGSALPTGSSTPARRPTT
ncbi:MAG: hypothetical protein EOO36_24900 [Cytophagaceae bacterium]|nr:MAG: hypothetical protein EOO36_24900 [Cytophagaceae bacterium]